MPQSAHRQHQQQGSPELPIPPAQQSPTSSSQQPSSGGRKISCEDIQLVQNLIERCLLLYMNQKDVVQKLETQARVEPGFTVLVWKKLEEQNPEFFKAYYTRLKIKLHIDTFNHLLDQQANLLQKMGLRQSPIYHPPPVQVSQMLPSHPGTPPRQMEEGLHPSARSETDLDSVPENLFTFGASAELPGMGLESNFVHHDPQSIDSLPTDHGDGLSTRDSLSSLSQLPRNFSLSDLTADLGPNSKFPRNFSLSDLTADLGSDFGALGNYSSPFVSDTEAYLRSPERDGFDEEPILEFPD